MPFTDAQIRRHNKLYGRGCSLIRKHVLIHGESRLAWPSWLARWRLRRGIALFQRALKINPDSWQSRFWIGKALQRLGDHGESMSWFADALRLDPTNTDIALEAGNEALQLGDYRLALAMIRPAAERYPEHAALQHNLGLAQLLGGQAQEAYESFSRAAAVRSDPLTANLVRTARLVLTGERPHPRTLQDLESDAL